MSENKKYYWLKIHETFFEDDKIQFIESKENGEKYILLWQKLLLKCLKNKTTEEKNYGFLKFTDRLPYTPELISKITRVNIDTVKVGMNLFQKLGMIEILEDGTIYIEEVNKMIGSETDSAERVRRHREKIKMLQCNKNVTTLLSYKEKDINKYINKKKEININKEKETKQKSSPLKIFYNSIKPIILNNGFKKESLIRKFENNLSKKELDNLKDLFKAFPLVNDFENFYLWFLKNKRISFTSFSFGILRCCIEEYEIKIKKIKQKDYKSTQQLEKEKQEDIKLQEKLKEQDIWAINILLDKIKANEQLDEINTQFFNELKRDKLIKLVNKNWEISNE